ncbi:hypothetical protein BDV12DRAFT_208867 [Aspergillus spectabilis]
MSIKTTPTWLLTGQNGTESLEFIQEYPLPELGENDVLVQIHAASLNYREIAIAKGKFSIHLPHPIIPSSDGAGIILATGSSVNTFTEGDKVITHLTGVHGTLRKNGIFDSSSLVKMPESLGFREAATLTCSGLTAWNALSGLRGKEVRRGHWVLVQGSGGVSVAALQFAVAAGATVIATTSSDTKAEKFTSLGAHRVVNYKETPNWGEIAKSHTPDSRGFDIIIDVGGPSTVSQSLKAIRPDGVIALAGLLGVGSEQGAVPSIMDGLTYLCTTRGYLLGTQVQFAEMNRFIDEKGVKPVADERVFGFGGIKEAYEYLEAQKHFSKIVIDIQ